jgi:hypothetical protein
MAPAHTFTVAEAFVRVRMTVGLTQAQLGDLLLRSRRTILRMERRGGTMLASDWEKLARATHARDRVLATQLAASAGKTLVDLGLEQPPPPPAPAAPPRPVASAQHLVDSVVCAAAEAMQQTPQAMRPGVVAAFERAIALGMSAQDVLQALAMPKGKAPASAQGKGQG